MIIRLIILSFLICCHAANAQNCRDVIDNILFKSNSDDIINGRKWIYEKRYLGSPMLIEKYWPISVISYKGIQYTGVVMNYDVYKNEMIIYQPEKGKEKYVVISKDYLSGFSFTDTVTKKEHFFEYVELPGVRGKSLYERFAFEKMKLYVKPLKNIELKSSGKGQGEFSAYFEYYLESGNKYSAFHSKRQLIKLLAPQSDELIKFIRRNNLKINAENPDPVIAVLHFFDGLN